MGFRLLHGMLVGILQAMGDALSEVEGLNAQQGAVTLSQLERNITDNRAC